MSVSLNPIPENQEEDDCGENNDLSSYSEALSSQDTIHPKDSRAYEKICQQNMEEQENLFQDWKISQLK